MVSLEEFRSLYSSKCSAFSSLFYYVTWCSWCDRQRLAFSNWAFLSSKVWMYLLRVSRSEMLDVGVLLVFLWLLLINLVCCCNSYLMINRSFIIFSWSVDLSYHHIMLKQSKYIIARLPSYQQHLPPSSLKFNSKSSDNLLSVFVSCSALFAISFTLFRPSQPP